MLFIGIRNKIAHALKELCTFVYSAIIPSNINKTITTKNIIEDAVGRLASDDR